MRYLLDTNVISAVAPAKAQRPLDLVNWMDQASDGLFLSVVTMTEVRDGIAKAAREGAIRKARDLGLWWETIEHLYGDRLLPFDRAAAAIAGPMTDAARAAGFAPGFADVAIAATAKANGLVVLTRNLRHFRVLTDGVLDPFEALPPLPGAG